MSWNKYILITLWKVYKYGVFSGPNTGNYGPEKAPYLDTFHAVNLTRSHMIRMVVNYMTLIFYETYLALGDQLDPVILF